MFVRFLVRFSQNNKRPQPVGVFFGVSGSLKALPVQDIRHSEPCTAHNDDTSFRQPEKIIEALSKNPFRRQAKLNNCSLP